MQEEKNFQPLDYRSKLENNLSILNEIVSTVSKHNQKIEKPLSQILDKGKDFVNFRPRDPLEGIISYLISLYYEFSEQFFKIEEGDDQKYSVVISKKIFNKRRHLIQLTNPSNFDKESSYHEESFSELVEFLFVDKLASSIEVFLPYCNGSISGKILYNKYTNLLSRTESRDNTFLFGILERLSQNVLENKRYEKFENYNDDVNKIFEERIVSFIPREFLRELGTGKPLLKIDCLEKVEFRNYRNRMIEESFSFPKGKEIHAFFIDSIKDNHHSYSKIFSKLIEYLKENKRKDLVVEILRNPFSSHYNSFHYLFGIQYKEESYSYYVDSENVSESSYLLFFIPREKFILNRHNREETLTIFYLTVQNRIYGPDLPETKWSNTVSFSFEKLNNSHEHQQIIKEKIEESANFAKYAAIKYLGLVRECLELCPQDELISLLEECGDTGKKPLETLEEFNEYGEDREEKRKQEIQESSDFEKIFCEIYENLDREEIEKKKKEKEELLTSKIDGVLYPIRKKFFQYLIKMIENFKEGISSSQTFELSSLFD